MFLDKISQNITQFRQYVVLGVFLFLVILPSFFSGEWSKWLQSIIFVVIFLLVLYIVILSRSKDKAVSNREKFILNPNFYLIIFLIIVFIASFFSVNKYNSFSQFFLLLSYAAIFFSAYLFFRKWKLIKITTNIIFFIGVVAALASLYFFLDQGPSRTGGFLFNANALGSYLLFCLPLGFILSYQYRKQKRRYLYLISFLLIITSFLLSYSYTGWVSFVIPFLILVYYYRKFVFQKRNLYIFLLVILIGFSALTFFRYQNSQDFSEAVSIHKNISLDHFIFSLSQRWNFNQSALEIFADNPILGSGYNTFQSMYGRYYHTVFEQPRYAHNYYFQTLSEVGIFGLVALLAFLFFLFKRVYSVVRKELDEERKSYLLGLGLGLVGSAIHACFDFGWQFPAVFILFWLISGMLMAWYQHSKEEIEEISVVDKPNTWFKVGQIISIILALAIFIRGLTLFMGINYFQKAENAENLGDISGIYEYFENGLKFDPDPAEVINYVQKKIKYTSEFTEDDFNFMEDQLKKVLSVNEEYYNAHWFLGKVYYLKDQYDLAEEQYRLAVLYNPVFRPDIQHDLALVNYFQEDYGEAKEVIFSILSQYPEDVSSTNINLPTQLAFLNMLLGDIYKKQDNIESARKYYSKALEYRPDLHLAEEKLKNIE
jgi:O-antigen ligase